MAVDFLGRELADRPSKAQTVAEFAVEQGTLDADDASVKAAIRADRKRSEEAAERAEQVSARMAPPAVVETPDGVQHTGALPATARRTQE